MKMIGFVITALLLGGAVAAYIKMPKDNETKGAIKLIKFAIAIMAVTLIGLFAIAALGSTTTIKLF